MLSPTGGCGAAPAPWAAQIQSLRENLGLPITALVEALSRYDRPALPDAFNSRLAARDARRAIREILTPCEHCFDDLYLYIDPADDELEPNIPYVARVALIMSELDTGNTDIVALAQKGQTEPEAFLKSCPGIEVIQ